MPRNMFCTPDTFAVSLQELVGDIPETVAEKTGDVVAKYSRRGAKKVKEHAAKGGKHAWSGEYVGGFSSRVKRGPETTGEIGNRAKPGLVHLLEKGHATLTGRRTNAYPHMAPAFDEIKDDFYKEVVEAVEVAL